MLRLTFVPESEREWYGVEGEDAEAILDAWNKLPAWSIFDPANFRQRIVEIEGAEPLIPGGMPAADEEILDALVKKAPDALKLETGLASPASASPDPGTPSPGD